MQAGVILTQSDVDNMVGSLARQLITLLVTQVPLVHAKIAALGGVTGLVGLPSTGRFEAMTTDEATALGSAMDEMYNLAGAFVGTNLIASGGAISAGSGHDFRPYIEVVGGFGF